MRLLLICNGETSEDYLKLTEKGIEQSKNIGIFLQKNKIHIEKCNK